MNALFLPVVLFLLLTSSWDSYVIAGLHKQEKCAFLVRRSYKKHFWKNAVVFNFECETWYCVHMFAEKGSLKSSKDLLDPDGEPRFSSFKVILLMSLCFRKFNAVSVLICITAG